MDQAEAPGSLSEALDVHPAPARPAAPAEPATPLRVVLYLVRVTIP